MSHPRGWSLYESGSWEWKREPPRSFFPNSLGLGFGMPWLQIRPESGTENRGLSSIVVNLPGRPNHSLQWAAHLPGTIFAA
jgi:hypothetical protein